jgi:sulfur carrier protein ThiS
MTGFPSSRTRSETMNVNITVHGMLQKKRPDLVDRDSVATEVSSVGELIAELNLSKPETMIVFVNGKRAGVEAVIEDGDEIKIFPLLGGG